jgi:hypothetical protein
MKHALQIVAAVILLGGPATLSAGERVALRVTPHVAFAPANLNIQAMVETDRANRSMQIEVDSSEFYRSSEIQLDGDHAPRTTIFLFRDLPGGVYQLRATVRGDRGETLASTRLEVDIVSQVQ